MTDDEILKVEELIGRVETINNLKQLKDILDQYANPVNIKIKEKKLGKKENK